ncbi:MAG: HK97 family phage prohead protease [Vicinamibacterales bacterium]|nr:HK97 family phage prohead protease [Vicinamibacterales bacterium]
MKDRFPLRKLLPILPQEMVQAIREAVPDVNAAEFRRKAAVQPVEELADGERAAIRYVSTRDIDRDSEIMVPKGAELTQFRLAPQVLWGHDYSQPPIGSDEWIQVDDYGLKAKTLFATTPRADEIWTLVKEGHLRTSSIGFVPLESVQSGGPGWAAEVNKLSRQWEMESTEFESVKQIYTKWLLLEHSDVSVPANIHALTQAVAKGLTLSLMLRKDLGIEEEDFPWASEKPFPNEHACRLRSPSAFQSDSFRRIEREHEGKKYAIIMGRLTGETTMTEQSYRYPKDAWMPDMARAHCKSHDGMMFEPASGAASADGIGRVERIIVRRVPQIVPIATPVDIAEIIREVIAIERGQV